jgi:hypothetical protein
LDEVPRCPWWFGEDRSIDSPSSLVDGRITMHTRQLIHPWQLATIWTSTHRRHDVVVTIDAPTRVTTATHWWATRTLPEHRSHYYPSRCAYLDTSELSRMMDHL